MLRSLLAPFFIAFIYFGLASQPAFANDKRYTYADSSHAFDVFKDIEWAKPKGFPIKMNIYVPKTGKKVIP
jgi:hypothetical protein